MTKDTGGGAFPREGSLVTRPDGIKEWAIDPQAGMSLRDYMAGQALMGLYASEWWRKTIENDEFPISRTAEAAYCQADAMLAERERA